MRFLFILVLLFGGCMGIVTYDGIKDDERLEAKIIKAQEDADLINELYNKNREFFLASVENHSSLTHMHSNDEKNKFWSTNGPYSVELEEHFPVGSSHVWVLPEDYLEGYLLVDVMKGETPDEYIYWLFDDGWYPFGNDPYSTAIKLTCSTSLLDYIREFRGIEDFGYPELNFHLNFKVTTKIINEFNESDEEDDFYFSQTFGAECLDYFIDFEALFVN